MEQANPKTEDACNGVHPAGHELAMGLRRAYMALHRSTNASLADCGVTADQFVLLTSLAEHGPMTQTQIAARTFSDSNTISAMLSRLEELGCVRRKRHKTDGRIRVVSLTKRGRTMSTKCSKATDAIRQRLTEQLQSGSLYEFIIGLNEVAERLEYRNTPSQGVDE